MTTLDAAGVTHPGQVRAQNQDTYFVSDDLVLIADGMGGYAGGEVAAAIAAEVVESSFAGNATPTGLETAVLDANRRIFERGVEPGLEGMGTTLVAAGMVLSGGRTRLLVANVGDSRGYLLRDGALRQLTEDHSVAAELVRLGRIDEGEGAEHPGRHVLTKVLGVDRDVEPDLIELEPFQGDRLLLCSDGLSNELDDTGILSLLSVGSPSDAARALVAAANAHGGLDNITAVVADVLGGAANAGDPQTMAVPIVLPRDRTQQNPVAAPPTPALAVRPVLSKWERFQRRREDRRRRRAHNKWVSFRGAVFLLAFGAVLVGGYVVLRWYGTQHYLVTLRHDRVVVIQGRTGGFLWWHQRIVLHERYGPGELPTQIRPGLFAGIEESSFSDAKHFIDTMHRQWAIAHGLVAVPSSTTTTTISSNFTTTTYVPTTTAATTGGT
ncbi:MAG TPA: protein phosphatase 2C domain-containing protein [Acidimicrobiales bacterium]|jgi:protein phosphatase|nr:protein phosphatase 2C domain-containing protein [Acidimicrobiales bacterium]